MLTSLLSKALSKNVGQSLDTLASSLALATSGPWDEPSCWMDNQVLSCVGVPGPCCGMDHDAKSSPFLLLGLRIFCNLVCLLVDSESSRRNV